MIHQRRVRANSMISKRSNVTEEVITTSEKDLDKEEPGAAKTYGSDSGG